eukprot:TRINITY_DN2426_c0_g1_i2.p1 TRINITY_DN2426_c0_g1~~TRINITY_DN2426_c0_g1_i2.p1  ORF type:complete len:959 (-),score=41.36 TRINITY_DN2426_c0_g1_i2:166-3042(-)
MDYEEIEDVVNGIDKLCKLTEGDRFEVSELNDLLNDLLSCLSVAVDFSPDVHPKEYNRMMDALLKTYRHPSFCMVDTFLSFVSILNSKLDLLPEKSQDCLVEICEDLLKKDVNKYSSLLPFTLMWLLAMSLDQYSKISDIRRVSVFFESLYLFDYEDEDTSPFISLLKRCVYHPTYLKTDIGRKCLSLIFRTSIHLLPHLHSCVMATIRFLSLSHAKFLGEVILRAYRKSDALIKVQLDNLIQDVAKHALLSLKHEDSKRCRRFLEPFSSIQNSKEIESTTFSIIKPLVLSGIQGENMIGKMNAYKLLNLFFPLIDPFSELADQKNFIEVQLDWLLSDCSSSFAEVRACCVNIAGDLLCNHSIVFDGSYISKLLAIVQKLMADSAVSVRISAIQSVDNVIKSPTLNILGDVGVFIPLLHERLFDSSMSVRTNVLKVYETCLNYELDDFELKVEELLYLAIKSSHMIQIKIARLLFPMIVEKPDSVEEKCNRMYHLIDLSPLAMMNISKYFFSICALNEGLNFLSNFVEFALQVFASHDDGVQNLLAVCRCVTIICSNMGKVRNLKDVSIHVQQNVIDPLAAVLIELDNELNVELENDNVENLKTILLDILEYASSAVRNKYVKDPSNRAQLTPFYQMKLSGLKDGGVDKLVSSIMNDLNDKENGSETAIDMIQSLKLALDEPQSQMVVVNHSSAIDLFELLLSNEDVVEQESEFVFLLGVNLCCSKPENSKYVFNRLMHMYSHDSVIMYQYFIDLLCCFDFSQLISVHELFEFLFLSVTVEDIKAWQIGLLKILNECLKMGLLRLFELLELVNEIEAHYSLSTNVYVTNIARTLSKSFREIDQLSFLNSLLEAAYCNEQHSLKIQILNQVLRFNSKLGIQLLYDILDTCFSEGASRLHEVEPFVENILNLATMKKNQPFMMQQIAQKWAELLQIKNNNTPSHTLTDLSFDEQSSPMFQ